MYNTPLVKYTHPEKQKTSYKKQVFLTESKEQHQNEQKLLRICKEFSLRQDLALYAKVLSFCPNSLKTIPETQWLFN